MGSIPSKDKQLLDQLSINNIKDYDELMPPSDDTKEFDERFEDKPIFPR